MTSSVALPSLLSFPGAFSRFEWMVALRYLRAQRAQGFVSIIAGFSFLGILLGVATLIVVMSVMNGFHRELLDKIIGVNGHIFLQSVEEKLTDYDDVVRRLETNSDVTLAIPMVEGYAAISSPYKQAFALVRGIKEKDIKRLSGIASTIQAGTLDHFDEGGGVAIGSKLAQTLSVGIGDQVSLLTARGAQTAFGVTPRLKAYPVKAIFQIGLSEFDNIFVFLPFSEAQNFFNREDEASVVEVFVKNPESIDQERQAFDSLLPHPLMMTDWRERNKSFFDALKVERTVMFLILTLIVLVAALNIISGLTMLVKNKSHDIAILKTMGAPSGSILRIFFITGSMIGVTGTAAGVGLGLLITHYLESIRLFLNHLFSANIFDPNIYFLSHLPSIILWGDITKVVGLSLFLSFIATLYPAWRAARLDPVQALRYE